MNIHANSILLIVVRYYEFKLDIIGRSSRTLEFIVLKINFTMSLLHADAEFANICNYCCMLHAVYQVYLYPARSNNVIVYNILCVCMHVYIGSTHGGNADSNGRNSECKDVQIK